MRKIMLVTGGSAGIGAATARMAGEHGYDVAVNYNSDRHGAEAAAEAVRAAGGRALPIQADVSDPSAVAAMFEKLDAELGTVDVLVNNAGMVAPLTCVEDITPERLARILGVNVNGSVYCAQQAVRRMSAKYGGKGGSIINLSSAAATLGAPNQYVDYAAAKGAIDSFTIGLSLEQAPHGVRVNAVRPGIIDTPLHGKGGEPDRAQELGSKVVPMQRAGSPDEVAEAILWLASDAASYVTAEIMKVTGGR